MKTLVVYYSRTGNSKKVAEEIAFLLKGDCERIIDLKDRSGVVGWVMGGRDGMNKSLTKIEEITLNPAEYDFVILGSPIWVSLPPAMRTFISEYKQGLKKVAFFCTMGGSGSQNMFKEMETLSGMKPIVTIAITDKEIQTGEYKQKIEEFVKKVQ
ncbi:MAG: hypothetical protein NTV98_01185 [Candidatus Roizmanbacteria bacterium]|nr:hypothetical protein [Candidatus Roizmanbacteria bacterium]